MFNSQSAAAYADIKPKAPSIREQVLETVRTSVSGLSRTQIASILGILEITAGSRITELLQSGDLKRSGETRLSTSGKPEAVYVIGDGVPMLKSVKETNERNPQEMATLLRKLDVHNSTLGGAFIWRDTKEGHDFWKEVHNLLDSGE